MDKELLTKIWIVLVLFSFILALLASFLMISPFWLFASIFVVISIPGLVISITGIGKKTKFSGFLLITIIVAGIYVTGVAFWAWLSPYCSGCLPFPKHFQLVDYYCASGTARVVIRNGDTESINTACINPLNGNNGKCGDLTITKTAGGNFNGALLNANSINPTETVIFTENCGIDNNCTYAFSTSLNTIAGEGRNQQVARVNC